jgi:hypothetical protein
VGGLAAGAGRAALAGVAGRTGVAFCAGGATRSGVAWGAPAWVSAARSSRTSWLSRLMSRSIRSSRSRVVVMPFLPSGPRAGSARPADRSRARPQCGGGCRFAAGVRRSRAGRSRTESSRPDRPARAVRDPARPGVQPGRWRWRRKNQSLSVPARRARKRFGRSDRLLLAVSHICDHSEIAIAVNPHSRGVIQPARRSCCAVRSCSAEPGSSRSSAS